METKIMNWLENHKTVYGVALLIVSVFTAAFSGSYIGTSTAITNNNLVTMAMHGYTMNDVTFEEDDE